MNPSKTEVDGDRIAPPNPDGILFEDKDNKAMPKIDKTSSASKVPFLSKNRLNPSVVSFIRGLSHSALPMSRNSHLRRMPRPSGDIFRQDDATSVRGLI